MYFLYSALDVRYPMVRARTYQIVCGNIVDYGFSWRKRHGANSFRNLSLVVCIGSSGTSHKDPHTHGDGEQCLGQTASAYVQHAILPQRDAWMHIWNCACASARVRTDGDTVFSVHKRRGTHTQIVMALVWLAYCSKPTPSRPGASDKRDFPRTHIHIQ